MKKAFVFSLIAVLIVLAFSFIMSNVVVETLSSSAPSYVIRANAVDTYYELLVENYLPSVLEVSSYAALQTMSNFTVKENEFYPVGEFDAAYKGLLENETFSISIGSFNDSYIFNKSVKHWTMQFEQLTKDFLLVQEGDNVTIKMDYDSVEFTQSTPWEMVVSANFNITLQSRDFTIGDQKKRISSRVSLLGLNDPLYSVYSNGSLLVPFRNETEVVNVWTTEMLLDAISEHKYYLSQRGPSFLQRYQNITLPSSAGVESLIDPQWVYFENVSLKSFNVSSPKRSYVDYLFFNNSFKDCQSASLPVNYLYNISGVSNQTNMTGFRLDFNSSVRFIGPNYGNNISNVCGHNIVIIS